MIAVWGLGVITPCDFYLNAQPAQYRPLVLVTPMRLDIAGDTLSNIFAYLLEPRLIVWGIFPECRPQPCLCSLVFKQGIWGARVLGQTDNATGNAHQEVFGNARRLGQAVPLGYQFFPFGS